MSRRCTRFILALCLQLLLLVPMVIADQVQFDLGIVNQGSGTQTFQGPVNIGISPAQLPAIIEAATKPLKDLTDEQRQDLEHVRAQLDVSTGALQRFLQTIGEADVPAQNQAAKLTEIAERYKDLQAQLVATPEHDPAVTRLRGQAKEALDSGDLDRADALLGEIQKVQDAEADKSDLDAAATSAQRAEIALTRLRYLDAAALFAASATRIPTGHEMERNGYLDRQAVALSLQGQDKGDNAALDQAITIYRDLLKVRTRERVPLEWVRTQMHLGIALWKLGERESGTARLEQAVTVLQAALKKVNRERDPLEWARTQINLGNALAILGDRENSTARLEQAVAAYQAMLKEATRDRVPLEWARTQINLSNVLVMLGNRENGTARLEQAVAAYRAALKEITRERDPLDWARTQMNLGNALTILGDRENSTARLEQAVAAYQATLKEVTRDRAPLEWARTQINLGGTLGTMGRRERRKDLLVQALRAVRNAQAVCLEYEFQQFDADLVARIKEFETSIATMETVESLSAR